MRAAACCPGCWRCRRLRGQALHSTTLWSRRTRCAGVRPLGVRGGIGGGAGNKALYSGWANVGACVARCWDKVCGTMAHPSGGASTTSRRSGDWGHQRRVLIERRSVAFALRHGDLQYNGMLMHPHMRQAGAQNSWDTDCLLLVTTAPPASASPACDSTIGVPHRWCPCCPSLQNHLMQPHMLSNSTRTSVIDYERAARLRKVEHTRAAFEEAHTLLVDAPENEALRVSYRHGWDPALGVACMWFGREQQCRRRRRVGLLEG